MSSSGALYASIVGVSCMEYFKYSFFIWLVWIIALFYAATGICIKKLNDQAESSTAEAAVNCTSECLNIIDQAEQ